MSWLIACALLSALQLQPAADTPPGPATVRLADATGDGLVDLLIQDADGSVLFWAVGTGAYERSGDLSALPEAQVEPGLPNTGAEFTAATPTARLDPDSPLGRFLASTARAPIVTAHDLFASVLVGAYVSLIEAQYVNDDANEVSSADILDFSLAGRDVSTTGGDVTFPGAVLTAKQGVFGTTSNPSGSDSTVSGGRTNTASGPDATVSGGHFNIAAGSEATVSGGSFNLASSVDSTVSGGNGNTASNWFTTVGGGYGNDATQKYSTVGGGYLNTTSGYDSTVPGGHRNQANGDFSFAAGRSATANHSGAFVWGDGNMSVPSTKTSSASNQFNIYASGGTRIFSNTAATAGVLLAPGGNSWSAVSDRNAKEHFEPVDVRAVLDAVASLHISTWNYKTQDDAVRHMGPMAQDFRAAFGLGVSDRLIDTVDPDGVALAAIQGLRAEKDAEIAELKAELAELKAMLTAQPPR